MSGRVWQVLFLCTGNSARSIVAEAILNRMGVGGFVAFSAGSSPKGEVHPQALALLAAQGYDTTKFRSKSWDEFAGPGAPSLDLVITVCDSAARESCPVWLGHPVTAHWGLPDPAAATGSADDVARAFRAAYATIEHRIEQLTKLPIGTLDSASLQDRLDHIGKTQP